MLIKRHLLMFFRDKANVLFSLLSVFIIIMLFVLFLGDVMVQSVESELGFSSDGIPIVVAGIMLGGMVGVTSVTSCMGALGIRVADHEGAGADFFSSPLSRRKIAFSYVMGSTLVGLLMTGFALIIVLGYLLVLGSGLPSLAIMGKHLLTLALSVLCANSMMYLVTLFIKSRNALSGFSAVIGSLIGFVMGIYLPIGQLPNGVGWVIRLFPMSHSASMFRQLLADGQLEELFAGAPPEALASMREFFGVTFLFGEFQTGFWFSAAVLLVSTAVFYGVSLLVMKRKSHLNG